MDNSLKAAERRPIPVKWVNVNKGNTQRREARSRPHGSRNHAQEHTHGSRQPADILGDTTVRSIAFACVLRHVSPQYEEMSHVLMLIDITRAYWHCTKPRGSLDGWCRIRSMWNLSKRRRRQDSTTLWFQTHINEKEIMLKRNKGSENPSDLGAKYLEQKTMWNHVTALNFEPRDAITARVSTSVAVPLQFHVRSQVGPPRRAGRRHQHSLVRHLRRRLVPRRSRYVTMTHPNEVFHTC